MLPVTDTLRPSFQRSRNITSSKRNNVDRLVIPKSPSHHHKPGSAHHRHQTKTPHQETNCYSGRQTPLRFQERKPRLLTRLSFREHQQMPTAKETEIYNSYKETSFYTIHVLERFRSKQIAPSYRLPAIN
eukprot:TCONS_00048591-protein